MKEEVSTNLIELLSLPVILVFIGAILIAIGTLWKAHRESQEKIQMANHRTEFERQLHAKTEEIANLNQYIQKSIIGGNSYCYIYFGDAGNNHIMPIIKNSGEYPLYDIKLRLMDLDNIAFSKNYPIGNLGPGQTFAMDGFQIQERNLIRLKADFIARNGNLIEMIHGRKVNKIWRFAIQLSRFGDGKILFEDIPSEFPTDDNGDYDWNTKE